MFTFLLPRIIQGDSGGPLQVKLESECQNTWEQIGITSIFSAQNYKGKTLTLQLFVKVQYYVPWIVGIIWPD